MTTATCFSIDEGDGKTLFKCWSGCSQDEFDSRAETPRPMGGQNP